MLVCNQRMVLLASPLASTLGNPLIVSMFEFARDAILEAKKHKRKLDSWQATGPGS